MTFVIIYDNVSDEVIEMFGKRLKAAREKRGLTMDALVEIYKRKYPESGLNKGTISKYENGKQEPMVSTVRNFAEILGVSTDYLTGKSDNLNDLYEKNEFFPVGKMYNIPVIGSVRCGFGGAAFEEHIGYDYANVANPDEYVFFQVKGDSMAPDIKDGDLALVHKQPDVESNELAIVVIDGEEGALKKVIKQSKSIILQSFNPAYPPRVFTGDELNKVCICGKVVETKRKW